MSSDPFIVALEEWIKVSMHRSMRNFIRYSRQSGLSMSHMGAMYHIQREGICGVTELGNHLDVTSAAASQMLERLVQQELIRRTEDPDDRRVKQIELTEKGKHLLEEAIHARQSWVKDLTESLSQVEKDSIRAALDTLTGKVRALKQPLEVER